MIQDDELSYVSEDDGDEEKDVNKVVNGKNEKNGKIEKNEKNGKIEKNEKNGKIEKKDKKKKKTSKNRRHERRMKSKSIDSLYSSSEGEMVEVEGYGMGSGSESERERRVKRSVLIRDIPKINKFNVYGTKVVEEFFREYEGY